MGKSGTTATYREKAHKAKEAGKPVPPSTKRRKFG